MPVLYKCDYCGRPFVRDQKVRNQKLVFCSMNCRSKSCARARKLLPHTIARIRITQALDVYPQCAPKIGAEYTAERYDNGSNRTGYVIEIDGKRINVRCYECIEI